MSRVCVKRGRFHLCTAVFLVAFFAVAGRLVYIQVIEAEAIAGQVQDSRKRLISLEAKRGDILDRNGNLLAGTQSRVMVGLDPQILDAEPAELQVLAALLEMPAEALREKAERRTRTDSNGQIRQVRWVPLAEVDEAVYGEVLDLGLRGVYGNRRYERYYPGKELGSHLIGYLNKEQTAVMGVEQAMNFYLKGQAGWRETEVDGQRRELAAFREREVDPRDGLHVELSIDLFVQSVVEETMRDIVAAYDPAGVSIIVSEPASGEILGMANWPTFDPNRFWEFPIENQRNRAITDQYEPGSTFKIVPVAAALEEGLVGPETLIDCGMERRVYNGVNIPLPRDHRNLGTVPVRTVVAKSSNRGAAYLGMLLGENRLHDYASRFGFGARTGWLLGGEISGVLMAVSDWDGYTISRLPTGYAIGATPLQVHLAMATLANDGVHATPRLVRRVIDPETGESLSLNEVQKERVVSPETAAIVTRLLTGVVGPEGTARRAELPGYEVAGKTGTSRKLVDGQYVADSHVGSFSGFFPASDPRVVITVVVDDAQLKGSAYGGVVAAPFFKEMGQRLIPHLAIKKPQTLESFIVSN
jgi:cell division protein FtsI/penicillin-binding protein 2